MPDGIGHDAVTAPSRSGEQRILIADDEEDFAEFLRDLLVEQGYRVDVVYNGRAGIELMEHLGAPSVLLLDIRMPKMDGYEVMEEMARRGLKPEVIVMTAFPNAIERTRLLRLGARAVLSKLLPSDVILQEIARVSLP